MTAQGTGSDGGMRLTGPGRLLLIVVGLAVLGYAGWTYRDRLGISRLPGTGQTPSSAPATTPGTASVAEPTQRKGVLGRIKQTGVLRVGMEPDAPPLHFINTRKQEDGFDFRLAAVIAEGIGAKRVEVVEADYDELPG